MSYHRHDPDDMSEFERQFADVHDPFLDEDRFERARRFDDALDDALDDPLDDALEDEFDAYDAYDDPDDGYQPIRRGRAVRWTAILIVASFAAGALSSVVRWL